MSYLEKVPTEDDCIKLLNAQDRAEAERVMMLIFGNYFFLRDGEFRKVFADTSTRAINMIVIPKLKEAGYVASATLFEAQHDIPKQTVLVVQVPSVVVARVPVVSVDAPKKRWWWQR